MCGVPLGVPLFRCLDSLCSLDMTGKSGVKANVNGKNVEISLENESEAFAFFVRLSFHDEEGNLISPVFFDDNYVSVPGGRTKTVKCVLPDNAKGGKLTLTINGWNVETSTLRLQGHGTGK